MSLRIVPVTSTEALDAIETAWGALNQRGGDELSTSPLWLRTWWSVFGSSDWRRLRVLMIFDGDTLVGLAPLLMRPTRYRRLMPLRRLELLGTGEDEADEICSDYNGVVCTPGYESAIADALADYLVSAGGWEHLLLHNMDGQAAFPSLFAAALTARGCPTQLIETTVCPYIVLPKTYEAYCEGLPSSRRKFVRKSRRDFEKWAPDHRFTVAKTHRELARGREVLELLHGERWQHEGETGVFASSRFRSFQNRIMAALLARDALQLAWVEGNGKPLAVVYNFIWKNRVYGYQSGRAVDLPNAIRAGLVSHLYAIEHAIAHQHYEYDFLAGTQRYKIELSMAQRPLVQLSAWRGEWLHKVQGAVDSAIALAGTLRARAASYKRTESPSGSESPPE